MQRIRFFLSCLIVYCIALPIYASEQSDEVVVNECFLVRKATVATSSVGNGKKAQKKDASRLDDLQIMRKIELSERAANRPHEIIAGKHLVLASRIYVDGGGGPDDQTISKTTLVFEQPKSGRVRLGRLIRASQLCVSPGFITKTYFWSNKLNIMKLSLGEQKLDLRGTTILREQGAFDRTVRVNLNIACDVKEVQLSKLTKWQGGLGDREKIGGSSAYSAFHPPANSRRVEMPAGSVRGGCEWGAEK
jgi:hypothetical protein